MKDEEWEILDKKTLGNTDVPSSVNGFQCFNRKDK